jgi:hypothetical protein
MDHQVHQLFDFSLKTHRLSGVCRWSCLIHHAHRKVIHRVRSEQNLLGLSV